MRTLNIFKWAIAIIFIVMMAMVYRIFNPIHSVFFPKCPFLLLTGLKCPGCGSQRAIHYLLNFDILKAINENVLLVLSIPYLLAGIVFESLLLPSDKMLKWRKRLFGQRAIIVIIVIVMVFWIFRNITMNNMIFIIL
ncbi:DUF2752 domain-containing protein [Hydrotalea sandarakina]|jgi:hypothetical protein|uniref:Uncharacterized protein DUF2752 n=1 Tax=Hydrotalea sandarakina TaxID=1004304 RepID=A0A2W7RZI1_9BACT|nr:DUF2752 domain-containing protein [Hydrotalea sandarakina]PZX60049.1 uncharacterized protein DUF2752 [Hydrotalea sandarakina]